MIWKNQYEDRKENLNVVMYVHINDKFFNTRTQLTDKQIINFQEIN